MGWKVYLNYILWRAGIRDILPRDVIDKIPISESNEKLVSLVGIPNIILPDKMDSAHLCARKSVVDKIRNISNKIDGKYNLMILSAYRSLERQRKNFDKKLNMIKAENPDLSDDEIFIRTRKIAASPYTGFGGHQTGGALDVTLCDTNGKPLDMGTEYSELTAKVKTKTKDITQEQAKNRQNLCDIMGQEGFINYPNEWWHFCYGDRMWAAYSKKKNAIYGYVEKQK